MMKNKVLVLSCCLALLFCVGAVSLAGAAEAEPKVGQSVGIAKFKAPITEEGAKYLGLAKADAFTLADVKAPYLSWWSSSTPPARTAWPRPRG